MEVTKQHEQHSYKAGNALGGCITLLCFSALGAYFVNNSVEMSNRIGVKLSDDRTTISNSELDKTSIRFGDYLNSMNLFLKVTDDATAWGDDFDLLDNKYFKVKSYIADDVKTDAERDPHQNEVKLIKCPTKEIQKFYHDTAAYYYTDRTICFENPDNITLTSDWWVRKNDYYTVVVALEKCKETPDKKCANETEREKYFNENRLIISSS